MPEIPRSAYDQTDGIYYFARMLDKIRLHAAGRLHPDYHANLGIALSGDSFCCDFLRVSYPELTARVLGGGTDDEILRWCYEQGWKPGNFDRILFNEFMRKLGWRDQASSNLRHRKTEGGLSDRDDIQTMMDYFDVDEGRKL